MLKEHLLLSVLDAVATEDTGLGLLCTSRIVYMGIQVLKIVPGLA